MNPDLDGIHSRTVTAHRHRIRCLESGTGPLVLMVHGFPGLSYSWRHQLPALAQAGYHAVAIDQLGYGRSSKPVDVASYRITELVEILVDVVKALGHSTATIVGHDWGAPVVWTAAWIRPDVFEAVVALSVPFGGRGLMAFPGSVHGEMHPREVQRAIAGPDLIFYQEYFSQPGIPEQVIEEDVRGWLTSVYYRNSGDAPRSEPIDLETTDYDVIVRRLRQSHLCFAPGDPYVDARPIPAWRPDWMTEEDLEYYVAEFERTGFKGAIDNYYRNLELNWELLSQYEGKPVTVPALFVTSDGDGPMLWSREGINRMAAAVPELRGTVIYENCGHWIQQERADDFNTLLLGFLDKERGSAGSGDVDSPTRDA